MTTNRDTPDAPCALMRGSIFDGWRLDDVSGRRLAFAYGLSYEEARAEFQARADELGYHLSAWSDADDR